MIDNRTILEYEKPIADAYAEATRLLVENIAKHIASGAGRTAVWETQKLQELGLLNRENVRIIREALANVPDNVRAAMSAGSQAAYDWLARNTISAMLADDRPPDEINAQYIEYWSQTAIDKFNMTNTTMLQSAQQAYIRAVNGVANTAVDILSTDQQKQALGTLNTVAGGILSGGLTLAQAKKKAIEDLADEGIYGFVDKAGRHWTPEAYTSMVLRTTVHNVDIQSTKSMSQQFGVDVFQCSWHPNSRPSHYDYQGKFYSWSDEEGTFTDGLGEEHTYEPVSNTGYGDAAGLFGINCGHTAFPMDEGVSVPFDPAEIQDREASDKGYAEAQKQRAIERSIRDAKTKAEVYKIAGDSKKAAEWSAKVRDRQATMRQFLKETGRTRSPEREKIYGKYGNVLPAEKVVANPKLGSALEKSLGKERSAEYLELVKNADPILQRLYEKFADNLREAVEKKGNGWCEYGPRRVVWCQMTPFGKHEWATLAHEMGHFFDSQLRPAGLEHEEVSGLKRAINASTLEPWFPSQSDKFLQAMREDRKRNEAFLERGSELNDELHKLFLSRESGKTAGIQDAFCGWWSLWNAKDHTQVAFGHTEQYYNTVYNDEVYSKKWGIDKRDKAKEYFRQMGESITTDKELKQRMRDYDAAMEVWANAASAVTVGGDTLDAFAKHMPNSLRAFLEIAGEAK